MLLGARRPLDSLLPKPKAPGVTCCNIIVSSTTFTRDKIRAVPTDMLIIIFLSAKLLVDLLPVH